jgi:hypothetical protein
MLSKPPTTTRPSDGSPHKKMLSSRRSTHTRHARHTRHTTRHAR